MVSLMLCLISSVALSADDAIKLRWTTVSTTTHPTYIVNKKWAEKINKKTNGRVQITVYPVGTLNPPFQTYNAVKTGIADIGSAPVGFSASVMPLNKLFGDAIYGVDSAAEAARLWTTALVEMPELRKVFEGIHLLFMTSTLPLSLSCKTKIEKMEDCKGIVMRFPPGLEPLAKAWGATPITIPSSDIYVSLQKGIVKGYFAGNSLLKSMRLAEHIKYSTTFNMVFGLSWIGMNIKKWESLPQDIKQIITDLCPEAQRDAIRATDEVSKESMEYATAEGVEFYQVDPVIVKRFETAGKKVYKNIAEDLEKRGKPGKKVLAELERLLAQ
jgi:TRAP-type C4-dicarboxylate transport system substrate-binding protein